jgi:hypothetical protein
MPEPGRYLSREADRQHFTEVRHRATIYGDSAPTEMTVRKAVRILCLSMALVALLVFVTGVVSDWNHNSTNDDARCPYCHWGHQTPAQLEAAPSVALLNPLHSLPLLEDIAVAIALSFSQIAPRAPPAA